MTGLRGDPEIRIIEWMRMVSAFTEEDPGSFGKGASLVGALFCQGHPVAAEKRAEFGKSLIIGGGLDWS